MTGNNPDIDRRVNLRVIVKLYIDNFKQLSSQVWWYLYQVILALGRQMQGDLSEF